MLTGKTITVEVRPNDTVHNPIKALGEEDNGYEFWVITGRLLYASKQLEIDRSLSDCGIGNNSTVFVVLRLLGSRIGR